MKTLTETTQQHNIERIYKVVESSLFMTTGHLDYDRITDAIIKLAGQVHDYDGDTMDIWYVGESGVCTLVDLITGAYWHYTEWHSGQWSKGYAALSSLGEVFNPGMSCLEPDSIEYEAYQALNNMAQEH